MLQVRISVVRESKAATPSNGAPPRKRPRWRQLAALSTVLAAVAVALVAGAGAAPTTDTRAVDFVPITPKQVWGNNSINSGAAESVVVIGGTTTVPTNATTVQLEVTAKGTAAGSVELFPAGNRFGAATNHTVSWTAGSSTKTITAENVGTQNKVTVLNHSTKAAAVTVRILGYSTQVTAGDINGSGGSAGQVLTNNGNGGATWKRLSASDVTGLPKNDGFGASAGSTTFNAVTTVATLAVPAGNYLLQFTGEFENHASGVNTASCDLISPAGSLVARTRATATAMFHSGTVALVGLGRTTTGGSFRVQCRSMNSLAGAVFDARLVAVQLDNISGNFSPARQRSRRG